MDQQEFLKDFGAQFEEVDVNTLKMDTELETIDEWGSLQALVIIAMLDSKYKVKVTGAELLQTKTIADVYELAKSKQTLD